MTDINDRLAALEARHGQFPKPNIPPMWERFDQYEAAVNLAIRDLVKPGDLFFDVGANMGMLSATGSRAVGPYGRVIAFEVSPRALPQLMSNLNYWHASNVFVVPNAVWSVSGETISLYFGTDHYADTVFPSPANSTPNHLVKTVSLDDFCRTIDQVPSVVKMDIEGAELEALKGFETTLVSTRPALILETQSGVSSLADWLIQRDYRLFDTDMCQPFSVEPDPEKNVLINIIAIHADDKERINRYEQISVTTVKELFIEDLDSDDQSPFFHFGDLEAGRYVVEFDPAGEAFSDETITHMETLTSKPWAAVNAHVSPWNHLAKAYTRQPFQIDDTKEMVVRFRMRTMDDLPRMIKSMRILKLEPNGPKATGWSIPKIRL